MNHHLQGKRNSRWTRNSPLHPPERSAVRCSSRHRLGHTPGHTSVPRVGQPILAGVRQRRTVAHSPTTRYSVACCKG